ncbi:glutamine synthetase family protein [Granulosicoccus antarcticus]|uniref:Gamma-glutamylputrescine synthetase PuuA n=1 Tax=Granulosicoccus antarcticus IMCC3135 TaxID=1192854 RepID=A0A2Z2NQE8_9GAMM|nr:glutamine synthetase family protein [Granulosicoccus antarcticus]ASJ71878.1 Gamma-glutamylputrescine synthetase PuuA [Granulosicoccus antarcticus IMCC3135]
MTENSHSFLAGVYDLNGCLRGKRLPAQLADKLGSGAFRMPMSSIGVDIWGTDVDGNSLVMENGDKDGVCEPTGRGPLPIMGPMGSCPLIPMWMNLEEGTPFLADPRRALAHVLNQFAQIGLRPVVATELEFYLVDSSCVRATPTINARSGQPKNDDAIYSLDEIAKISPFLDAVYAMAATCNIPVETAVSEGGPGQFEFNLTHVDDALRAADDAVILKQIVKTCANDNGFSASFMAKPYQDQAGNGFHVHFSMLNANDENVFDNGTEEGSQLMKQALAGLINAMPATMLVFAPHLNSYRRLCLGGLAPTTAAWGYENRTAAIRIPGGSQAARRIEHRVAGADANPYLVLAAILGAALIGIKEKQTPPRPQVGNAHEANARQLPLDWRDATEAFEVDEIIATIFDPSLISMFLACKKQEQDIFKALVTDFEYQAYLDAV